MFTRREWEVMELLTQGYSNQRISNQLYITDKTVKNHISSILRKLEVPDRTNAVLTVLRNKWFYVS
ncbi:response regulator transcription factor [Gracilibacillus boraciitolerans]|uniref:response regulator transcription factor n=1 Tax=Gracilibacillus boraciitolerans TaxID=307521 RepID=UPI001F3B2033|nr:response regulator transcription factor [Gracilibacillus boraciitolerans]